MFTLADVQDLEKLKLSLRLDTNEDDELLKMYLETAYSYVTNAIGEVDKYPEFFELPTVSPLIKTATLAQATGYYTARTALSNTPMMTVHMSVNSIIGQLRARYDQFLGGLEADEN